MSKSNVTRQRGCVERAIMDRQCTEAVGSLNDVAETDITGLTIQQQEFVDATGLDVNFGGMFVTS
ncbi:hypothetical protein KIN20_023273 [Parelaphostrongylus tenuis]|uniref:Uncharacterized protein n=1 Tax=Parelaphostrongylus tenuis TaxID=148309 RepID=A0AAD5MRH8_PARTN|nr:hypothetical protein KIN20_023273 [Parelaphostrongylus tenuis]